MRLEKRAAVTGSDHGLLTDEEYLRKGAEVFEMSWNMLQEKDGWTLEKQTTAGDTVHSKHFRGVGKVFKLKGRVLFPPRLLLDELFYNIENVPTWNPSMTESTRLKVVDEHTDITYHVTPDYGGGLITSRDFVNLRHWEMRDGLYLSSGMSVTHPARPPQPSRIRGENGPGGWVISEVPGDPTSSVFQWLLRSNLHGWIPQYLVDKTLSSAMLNYMEHIRAYGVALREQGRF